jgi:hypothetical protein
MCGFLLRGHCFLPSNYDFNFPVCEIYFVVVFRVSPICFVSTALIWEFELPRKQDVSDNRSSGKFVTNSWFLFLDLINENCLRHSLRPSLIANYFIRDASSVTLSMNIPNTEERVLLWSVYYPHNLRYQVLRITESRLTRYRRVLFFLTNFTPSSVVYTRQSQ